MKNLLITVLTLFTISLYAQELKGINSELKIPDSLTFEKEIRIYRGFGIDNHVGIFRMYQDNSNSWKIENYNFYQAFGEMEKPSFNKVDLTSKTNPAFLWASLVQTKISELPDMSEIRYKMQKRGKLELIDGEYQAWNEEIFITDGIVYYVKVKNLKTINEIEYGNPESYLKHFPEIDELIFFKELLDLLRTELGIWKK